MVKGDYRGKGISETKSKTGEPKHAGNFSYCTIHHQSLQSKDYRVYNRDGHLIVGNKTPLSKLMSEDVERLALTDKHFGGYVQDGKKTVGVKEYEAHKRLIKFSCRGFSYFEFEFIYREEIYTDGDFDYPFPEY